MLHIATLEPARISRLAKSKANRPATSRAALDDSLAKAGTPAFGRRLDL